MRIINKLQQGGGIPAYVSYTNVPQPQATAPYTPGTTQASGSQEQENMLDKNMVKFLYENGIPSDVEAFIDRSGIFSSDLTSNPFKKDSSILQYKTILKMLPRIKAESDRFKQAMEIAEKNDGLNEIAVTNMGQVVTMTQDGDFNTKELKNVDFSKEKVLTNAELANYRANNINGAFSTDISNIISNGIGIPKVTEYIMSKIKELGTTSVTGDGLVAQKSGNILKGLNFIGALNPSASELAGMSLDGVYKVSGMNKTQTEQAKHAINYMMATMPKNMFVVLQAKAASMLGDNSPEGVGKLVTMLTNSALKNERSFTLDYKENLSPDGTKKSATGGKDDNIVDPAKGFVLGLGNKQMHKINNGTSYAMSLLGNESVVTDKSGKPIGNTVLSNINNSIFAGALDMKNVSMGSQLVDFTQMDRIALNGSKIVGVDLPVDTTAAEKGIIKPDFDSLKRVEAADAKIKQEGITDYSKINEIYASFNLPFKYTPDGNLRVDSYGRFAVLDAIADEGAFLEDVDVALDDTLAEVEDENMRNGVERILKLADKDYKVSSGGFFGLGHGTHLYSGSVYIPVTGNLINTAFGSGNYPTAQGNDAHQIQALEDQKIKLRGYQKPPTLSSLNP